MQSVAMAAIYLAAFRAVSEGPGDDLLTIWGQLVSAILLLFVLPFQVMLAWARSR
jgi:hypothetical protein